MLIRSDDSLPADRVCQTITSPTMPLAYPPLFSNDLVEFIVHVVFDRFEQSGKGGIVRSSFNRCLGHREGGSDSRI